MHLIEILMPLRDNQGAGFPKEKFNALSNALTERFGGLTAFTRAPAKGFWAGSDQTEREEDIVVLEVMTDDIDRAWWRKFRRELEASFRQREVIIRTHRIERL